MLLAALSCSLYAVVDPLEGEIAARPIALGSAYVALSNDGAGLFANPAGLSTIKQANWISLYSQPTDDTNQTLLGWTDGTWGGAYRSRTAFNIVISSETANYTDLDLTLLYSRQWSKELAFGFDLRWLSRALSKDIPGYDWLNGAGTMADIGIKYTFSSWLKGALVCRSLGGSITYKDGYKDNIALTSVGGLSLKLRGEGGYFPGYVPDLYLNIDAGKNVEQPLILWHTGLEWWLLDLFAARLGLDQSPNTTSSNFTHYTGGFGLKVKGVTFDYAIKKWNDDSKNISHYFSLGYVGPEEKKKFKPILLHFPDVPPGYWAKKPIEALTSIGIMEYYQDGNFYPERPMTRAEAVTCLARAKEYALPKTKTQVFSDVPVDFWAADYIQTAWENKITLGYPDKTFRPRQATNRVEEALFLARFDSLGAVTPEASLLPYKDLSITHWGISELLAACNKGLFEYLQEDDFSPERSLTRAEFAVTLYKTGFIKQKLKGIDW